MWRGDNATGNSSSEKNGNNVVLSYSDDAGVTFSPPSSASGNFIGRTGGIGADPYVAPTGTLHVAWQDYAHKSIADASSTNGGAMLPPPHTIAHVGRLRVRPGRAITRGALVYPACAARRSASSIYCSYMDDTAGGTKVFVAKSTDGGVTWPSVEADAGRRRPVQPVAGGRPEGAARSNVAYYDTGVEGAPSTIFTLARSTNAGSTYGAQAVANAPTDETSGAGVTSATSTATTRASPP